MLRATAVLSLAKCSTLGLFSPHLIFFALVAPTPRAYKNFFYQHLFWHAEGLSFIVLDATPRLLHYFKVFAPFFCYLVIVHHIEQCSVACLIFTGFLMVALQWFGPFSII